MKMTRLEWRYLQRIALDHPYFDTHELPLTEQEAKAIVEANVTMTGREFVDSVYEKLGIVRPKEEKKRLVWLRSIGELSRKYPGSFERLSRRRILQSSDRRFILHQERVASPVPR